MSIRVAATNANVNRDASSWFDPTTNWSKGFYFKYNTITPGGGSYRTVWLLGDESYTNPGLFLQSAADTNNVEFYIWDGVSAVLALAFYPITLDTWYYCGITYNSTTHDVKFYLAEAGNALVLKETGNYNISSLTFVEQNEFFGSDTQSDTSQTSFCFERTWQRVLTLNQLQEEMTHSFRVLTTNLLSSSNLGAPDSLTDTSGGHNWTLASSGNYILGPLTANCDFGAGLNIPKILGEHVNTTTYQLAVNGSGNIFKVRRYGTTGYTQSAHGAPAVYTGCDFKLEFIYRGDDVDVDASMLNPWTDPLVGTVVGDEPPISDGPWVQIAVLCKTSTWDRSLSFAHPNAFQQDGAIKFYIDGVEVYNVFDIYIKRTPSFGSNYNPGAVAITVGPGEQRVDGFWFTGPGVLPTFAGAEKVPTSPNLLLYNNFNGGVYAPFALVYNSGLGPAFNTNSGLDLTGSVDNFYYDATTQPSGGNISIGLGKALVATGYSQGYLYLASQLLGSSDTQSLIIIKQTIGDPLKEFTVNVGGGLSPSSFTLKDDENQTYDDIAVGTYSVSEDADADYTTTYNVSNGDSHTSISVGSGETVIVTITNTYTRSAGSGLFKLVPGQRNDQIDGEFVKIPNPFVETALLPEEN